MGHIQLTNGKNYKRCRIHTQNIHMYEKKSYLRKIPLYCSCDEDLCRRNLDLDTELFFLPICNQKEEIVFTDLQDQDPSPTNLRILFLFLLKFHFVLKSISFIKTIKLLYNKRFLLSHLRLERRKLVKFVVRTARLQSSSLRVVNHI